MGLRVAQSPRMEGMSMEITVTNQGGRYEIALDGSLDAFGASDLGKTLEEIPADAEWLTMDMTKLEYTSSAGIRQIVTAHKKMKGNLTLKNVGPEVLDVLQMTGIDKKMNIE